MKCQSITKWVWLSLFLLAISCAAIAQNSVTGTILPYATGTITELQSGSPISRAIINTQGFFTIPIDSTTSHVFSVNPIGGSAYFPYSVTVTTKSAGTTDITAALLAAMPLPRASIFPAINVLTKGVMINTVQYYFPSTQSSGCLGNDGVGNISWVACSGSGGGITLQTNSVSNPAQGALNLENGTNIAVSNPSGGNVTFSITGTLAVSTTGNAGTATALAANPTTCSSGQAPTGIVASGNSTGCAAYLPTSTQLPVSNGPTTHLFFTSYTSSTGVFTAAQPVVGDVTGAAPLASPTFTGSVTIPITGSTQCLHANSSGVISGTGADCGAGGGISYPTGTGIVVVTGGAAWGTTLAAPTGTIVGTSDTQTLTNKTVDGVTPTTFGFLDATSSIQTQLNAKAPIASPTFTTMVTVPTVTSIGATNGNFAYNSSALAFEGVISGTGIAFPWVSTTGGTTGHCVEWLAAFELGDTGAACGSGGGTGFPITIGSTSIASSSTTTTIAGLTLTSPTFTIPALGTPASGIITNLTGTCTSCNANTAATLTTSRTIAGTSFNGSANITLANKFIVQGTSDAGLSAAQFLGALTTGLLKVTTTTGVLSDGVNSDVIALWTGSCSASTFLRGDGACATASGSTGISGGVAGYFSLFGSSTTITAPGHLDEVTTAGVDTFTQPVNVTVTGTPSQIGMTYNSTAPSTGSSTTAVYAVSVTGLAEVSEAGGAFSEICTPANSACGSSGGNTTSTSLTTNAIPKANGANSIINSSVSDNGTTVSTPEPATAQSFVATGTTAGFADYPQGTTSSANAICATVNSICFQAPTSVTYQLRVFAGAPATGLTHWANSSGTMTETISGVAIADLTATGTPSSTTYLRGDNTWATISAGGSVTSIATTGPITGGTITTTGTIACATCVTSASALTANAIILGAGSQAAAVLGSLGTTTTVLHGNASGVPSFGSVVLSTDVSGQLPIGSVGSSGLSGTSPMAISAAGAISITANGITATQLAAQYSKGSCTELWGGSGTSFALTAGDDAISDNSCYNDSGVTRTITAVKCRSDIASNTTTVNPTFGSAGTGTTILSGALTCGSSLAYSSTGTVSNASWTTGNGINPIMGGTLTGTSIALIVEFTY